MPRLLAVFFSLFWFLPFPLAPMAHALELGIDRLEALDFTPLAGKRIGLITNQTGVNSAGVKTRLILSRSKKVQLVALFTPEHGLDGVELAGKYVKSKKDPLTGVVAHSLYGPNRKPSAEMLKGIDALVFDMQDIGCRSYTYISTMGKCMEAAGEAGIEFIVLDRPNPLGGARMEGPPMEPQWISFVGQFPVPYVHGMTVGELAKMGNESGWMGSRCKLSVIEMTGWKRHMTWPDTGLRWVQTSPNIPKATSPFYYVVTGLVGELAGLETGVGSPTPFEVIASRSLDANAFTSQMRSLKIPGVEFTPYSEGPWHGARLKIDPATAGDLTALGVAMLAECNRHAKPDLFASSPAEKLDLFFKCYGSQSIRSQLQKSLTTPKIIDGWRASLHQFETARAAFLLYH
jgi:uncharacterized protein YbbC (DUF1343 family)